MSFESFDLFHGNFCERKCKFLFLGKFSVFSFLLFCYLYTYIYTTDSTIVHRFLTNLLRKNIPSALKYLIINIDTFSYDTRKTRLSCSSILNEAGTQCRYFTTLHGYLNIIRATYRSLLSLRFKFFFFLLPLIVLSVHTHTMPQIIRSRNEPSKIYYKRRIAIVLRN